MASLLEGAIATTIGKAFASTFYACTVTRTTPGTGPDYDPGTPTTTGYACKGMVDTFSDYQRANSLVEANDRKILILAPSLSIEPMPDDTVTIRGATYTVINVKIDPALAVYELQARV